MKSLRDDDEPKEDWMTAYEQDKKAIWFLAGVVCTVLGLFLIAFLFKGCR